MSNRLFHRARLSLTTLTILALPHFADAQRRYNNSADDGGILSCLGASSSFQLSSSLSTSRFLVWVNKDAKSRGMDNSVVWMLVVLLTSFIGLIIYLLSRPKGQLVPCPRCNHKKLAFLTRCPHCGAAA